MLSNHPSASDQHHPDRLTNPAHQSAIRIAAFLLSGLLLAKAIFDVAYSGEYHNLYILVLPALSGIILYFDRRRIFQFPGYSPWLGAAAALSGLLLFLLPKVLPSPLARTYGQSISTFGAVLTVAAGFLTCFGFRALRRAAFPLALLLLAIPLPPAATEHFVVWLQNGSASCSTVLFRLLRVPALREGMTFSLPGLNIEIGEQCSGARSVAAFCVTCLLVSRFLIRTWWKQVVLVLCTIPLVIFKNAVRIVTIATLSIYVDRGFLHGHLHNDWGVVFSLIDLLVLTPIAIALYRSDLAAHPDLSGRAG